MRYFWIKFRGDCKAWPIFREGTRVLDWNGFPSEITMLGYAPVEWQAENDKEGRTSRSYRWVEVRVTDWKEFACVEDYKAWIGVKS